MISAQNMQNILLSEIAQREGERQQCESQRRALEARIGTLDGELALLRHILARAEAGEESQPAPAASAAQENEPRKKVAGANMSDRWKCVTRIAVARFPQTVQNDDVVAIQLAAGEEAASREAIRSHVWTFTRTGLYEKVGRGTFRATQNAADLIGLPLGHVASSGSPQGEPGSGQPRLDLNNLESVEAVDAARKECGI